MLSAGVLVGEVSVTERTAVGFDLEVQGFYVFAQVVLGAKELAAGIAVKVAHCFYSAQKRFSDMERREWKEFGGKRV